MRAKLLLLGAAVASLLACDSTSDIAAVDAAADFAVRPSPAAAEVTASMPDAFAVKQVSEGTGQPIGWCDEAAGVVRDADPGTGTGTHIGRFAIDQTMCVNTVTGAVTDGAATVITANGDEIYMTVEGQAVPGSTPPAFDLAYRVVGGTGRFANAEGAIFARVVQTSPTDWTATSTGWFRYSASDRSER